MKNLIALVMMVLISTTMIACGKAKSFGMADSPELPKINIPNEDGSVIRGRAVYTITNEELSAMHKFMNQLLMPSAYAATGTSTVSYNNAGVTSFTINVSNFTPGSVSNDILSLGNFSISALSDNTLKVCGVNSNQKCNKAIIRVYTTGSVAGFVNTDDNYGLPVYTGTLNPTTALGLNAAGAVQVQTYTIPSNSNIVKLSNFSNPTYNVTADFSNAGAGLYQMTYVVEYALSLN